MPTHLIGTFVPNKPPQNKSPMRSVDLGYSCFLRKNTLRGLRKQVLGPECILKRDCYDSHYFARIRLRSWCLCNAVQALPESQGEKKTQIDIGIIQKIHECVRFGAKLTSVEMRSLKNREKWLR